MGNTAAPPEFASREAFRWKPAGSGPDIRLRWSVMIGIEAEVIEGFKALPRRGAEIGGALIGHRGPGGEFCIESWKPIPIEHRSGPSYVLSEADLSVWKEFVESARATPERFIGIYRSQTRPGLRVTAEDCAIVEKFLPREQGVLLLVKPLSASESVATFYLCDGGAVVDAAAESREFEFGRKAVPPGAATEPVADNSAPEPPARPPAMAGDEVPAHTPPARSRNAPRSWKSVLLPASAIAAGCAAGFYIHTRGGIVPESPAPMVLSADSAAPELNLRTERTREGVRLLWNPDAPVVKSAREAVLLIDDSGSRTEERLGPTALQAGSLEWPAGSLETEFELRISSASGRQYAESVRVIGPRK